MSASSTHARMLVATAFSPLPRIPDVRLPNEDWLRFLSGPLNDADWLLIERVERGEVSVDAAMRARASGTGLSSAAPIEPCGLARSGFNPIAQGDGA